MRIPEMKIIFSKTVLIASCLLFLVCSCRKNNPSPGTNATVPGDLQLNVQVLHHSWEVGFIDVYLKRNATTFPGKDSSLYDLHVKADGHGLAVFTQLYPGNYYVYASGFDVSVANMVLGYAPVSLNSATLHDQQADLTLYVSE